MTEEKTEMGNENTEELVMSTELTMAEVPVYEKVLATLISAVREIKKALRMR